MNIEHLKEYGTDIAAVTSETVLITDVPSALDLAIAGEILQKFINYHIKAAIYGDYSRYTSKPLKDFIYESNNGKDFFFVSTKEEAAEKLSGIA